MNKLVCTTALAVALVSPAAADQLAQASPDPSLSPRDVVSIQVEALRNNDKPYEDRGIEVTFSFASPANRRVTGPIERFAAMVRHPMYAPMINHRGANFENLMIEGDIARVDVILTARNGVHLGYRFTLSRQHGNEYEGSWMTDSVVPFEVMSL